MPKTYARKSQTVTAERWLGPSTRLSEVRAEMDWSTELPLPTGRWYVNGPEGKQYLSPGDWVVTRPDGKTRLVKPDEFAATYAEVTATVGETFRG